MTNVFGWAIVDGVHGLLQRDPVWASLLADYAADMNQGACDPGLLQAMSQSPVAQPYTIYDAYCLHAVRQQISDGCIVHFELPIEGHAAANSDRTANRVLLSTLPTAFQTGFHGTAPGEDGYLEWQSEIVVTSPSSGLEIRLPPNRVPLEVGFTHSWTTWGHLICRTGLARLPYGSDRVSVFVRTAF